MWIVLKDEERSAGERGLYEYRVLYRYIRLAHPDRSTLQMEQHKI